MTENLFGMINDLAKKQSKQDETLQMILQLLKKFESANLTTNTPLRDEYILIDSEYWEGPNAAEFGYVVMDSSGHIHQVNRIMTKPNIRYDELSEILEADIIQEIKESVENSPYGYAPSFGEAYKSIKVVLECPNACVFGTNAVLDKKLLNHNCRQFGLQPFDFIAHNLNREIVMRFQNAARQNSCIKDDLMCLAQIIGKVCQENNITIDKLLDEKY